MVKIPFINLRAQYESIKKEIDDAIQNVIRDSAFIKGKYVESFEDNFAKFTGAKHCIGVGNGTDALFISLRCLGISAGDEVIVPANSFIATSEAVTLSGARVVFADCDPDFYTIDPKRIEEAITPKTKAIIPVHLYGQPAMMDEILALAEKHGLLVIEDAAQAHGAEYHGRKVGTLGRCAVFSFFPAKNLGAYGDGGAVVTNDDALAEKVRMFANHGRKDKYNHQFEGMNSRLDGMQAAILDVKLRHLDEWTAKRSAAARVYDRELKDVVVVPKAMADVKHAYHLYVIQVENRDALRRELNEAGVETGIHYPVPLPLLEAYGYLGHREGDFPVAERLAERVLSLPLHENLTSGEQKRVTDALVGYNR